MTAAITFADSHWHWLTAVALVLFAALVCLSATARRKQLAAFAGASLISRLLGSHSRAFRIVKNALLVLSLLLLGLALARPQWGVVEEEVARNRGEDVLFVLDLSKSMLAADVTPSRLQRAKLTILDFLHRQKGGRVGLVVFAGNAFLRVPLTADYDAFEESVAEASPDDLYVPGSDLARALIAGKNAFEKGDQRKVLVLFTDGEDLGQLGVKTAQEFAKDGIVVFTVGVGTPSGSQVLVPGPGGQPAPLLDDAGQPVVSKLDEETLRAIAEATGGSYHRLNRVSEASVEVLRGLKTTEIAAGAKARRRGIDRYAWPLGVAILLLLAESLLTTRRRESLAAAK
jgi:Ca-activated chloride channel family protein